MAPDAVEVLTMPTVSVVIPCFNQGSFVAEAIESVLAQSFQNLEIIVVNDGSTDGETIGILDRLDYPLTRVVHTANQGVAEARNTGIALAFGRYILPLDADDRIDRNYMAKAAVVLDSHPKVGFVYCLARLFGAKRGMFYLNKTTLGNMLLDSRVFCSAMFRKSDWEAAGGYNSNMVYGWEDWDFWLSLLELGGQPYMIEEVMFFYRVKKQSRTQSMTFEHKVAMHKQLRENHQRLYQQGKANIDFEKYHRNRVTFGGKLLELMRKILFNIKYLDK